MRKFGNIVFTEKGITVELPYEIPQNVDKVNLTEYFSKAKSLVRGRLNNCISNLQKNIVTSVGRTPDGCVMFKDGSHFSAVAAECMQSMLEKRSFDELNIAELTQVCKACVNPRGLTVDGKSEYPSSESVKIVSDIAFEYLIAKYYNK